MIDQPQTPPALAPEEAKWIVMAVAVIATIAWVMPAAVTWLYDGRPIPLVPALQGTVKLVGHHLWAHPRAAYPPRWQRQMPTGPVWWAGAAWALLTLATVVLAAWRRVDSARSRSALGRSSGALRGSRPRSWAKARDLDDLTTRHRDSAGFSLGTIDHRPLLSDPESHVAVIAPTRSGKTTRYVIPWLLEHDGPAIVTSTKTDVLQATRAWRQRQGQVTIWDPFGKESGCWTPLTGCCEWQHALAQAQWLADAAQEGDSELASYWRGEAARLLAPLLYAAAQTKLTITDVLEWVDQQDATTPASALEILNAHAALTQLQGITALDDRNRGSVYMSAGSLLAAYRLPAVKATAQHGLTPEAFLNGEANTLYIVASSQRQRLLTPLIVAIISSLLHAAAEHANAARPLSPTLRVLLDEAANIAALRDLPSHLSQAAGHGVRIATIWQSLAQAQQRYRHAADEILANSSAKLYLGPITDQTTRRHITELLGEEPTDTASINTSNKHRSQTVARTWRPKATPASLQQLDADHVLLIEGRHPPAVVRTRPWWEDRALRRRSGS